MQLEYGVIFMSIERDQTEYADISVSMKRSEAVYMHCREH